MQIDTLYNLTLQHHDRCTTCGTPHSSTNLSNETPISVGVDLNHTSIQQAIVASLQHHVDNVHCSECSEPQTKTRWTEIVAAPKILRVHLQIFHPQHKIFHHLTYPDLLDLTAHQQNRTLPLQYRLNSVIAHSGDYYTEEDSEQEEDSDEEELRRGTDDADSDSSALSSPALSDLTEMSDTDLAALEKELYPPPEPLKVMVGHYIASVREHDDNALSLINDSNVAAISHQESLTNPQDSNGQKFEVYVLTYVRDDSVRDMPEPIPERWIKETAKLMVGKGAGKPVVYPTVEPPLPEQTSKKRAAGQSGKGTKHKRSKSS